MEYFEVIEIVDDNNPYPMLPGLDQAFDIVAIINMKKRKMVFEQGDLRVIVPLDPLKGVRYTKPIRDEYCDADIDNIYELIINTRKSYSRR